MQEIIEFIMRHWWLFLALLLVMLALIKVEWDDAVGGDQAANLSPQQAVGLINHEQAVVVDMRPQEAYAAMRILAAISLTFPIAEPQLLVLKTYKAKPVILYGISDKEFSDAKLILNNQGINHVFYLRAGLAGWRAAGMPVEKMASI